MRKGSGIETGIASIGKIILVVLFVLFTYFAGGYWWNMTNQSMASYIPYTALQITLYYLILIAWIVFFFGLIALFARAREKV